jgi:hypothetical protein
VKLIGRKLTKSMPKPKIQAEDVYIVRREPLSHPVSKAAIDFLRQSGASDYTIRAATKIASKTSYTPRSGNEIPKKAG